MCLDGRVLHMGDHRDVSPYRAERKKSHRALHGKYVDRCAGCMTFERHMVFHMKFPLCGKPSSSSAHVHRNTFW